MQRKIETEEEEEEFKIISVEACSEHHRRWCFDSLSDRTFSHCFRYLSASVGHTLWQEDAAQDKVSLQGRRFNQTSSHTQEPFVSRSSSAFSGKAPSSATLKLSQRALPGKSEGGQSGPIFSCRLSLWSKTMRRQKNNKA